MHSFEVHSNESACRKSGSLGLEQVQDKCVLSFLSMCHKCMNLAQNIEFNHFKCTNCCIGNTLQHYWNTMVRLRVEGYEATPYMEEELM